MKTYSPAYGSCAQELSCGLRLRRLQKICQFADESGGFRRPNTVGSSLLTAIWYGSKAPAWFKAPFDSIETIAPVLATRAREWKLALNNFDGQKRLRLRSKP